MCYIKNFQQNTNISLCYTSAVFGRYWILIQQMEIRKQTDVCDPPDMV